MLARSSAGVGGARARPQAKPNKTSKREAVKPAASGKAKITSKITGEITGKIKAKAKTGKSAAKTAAPKTIKKPKPAAAAKTKSVLLKKTGKTTTAAAKIPAGKTRSVAAAPKPAPAAKRRKRKTPKSRATPDVQTVASDAVQEVIATPQEPKAAEVKKTGQRKPPPKPISLVLKVLGTINGELTKLEEHTGKSSQDRERASRALSQMVTSLEKAVDMQREITRDRSANNGAKDKEALRHAEDMRRQIAERLERLNRQRKCGGRSQGSDGG